MLASKPWPRAGAGAEAPARCPLPVASYGTDGGDVATGPHSVLFHRFYSGAGVCSPTRASVLTGRNNKRGCINSALPCDHMATEADACSQGPGLAHSEFTVADAAAKVGYRTIHLGKVSVHEGGGAVRV